MRVYLVLSLGKENKRKRCEQMYPMMVNIEGKAITIIGGGKVAYRKAMTFLKFGGQVRVISPQFDERFKEQTQIEYIQDNYDVQYLEKSFIVVAATNNSTLNRHIGERCEAKNILCNIIDNPKLSSFIVPSHITRGDLVISVSTHGKSPGLTKHIKESLEVAFDNTYAERVALLGMLREAVLEGKIKMQKIGSDDEKAREQYLKELVYLDLDTLRLRVKEMA